jgi:HD-like signal output (HDOD) protein/ActR/RegA family two-component response regulator
VSEQCSASARPIILFVDDDQRVLDGLAVSLRRLRSRWSMEFICGGAAALARLAAQQVDAVVTDMRMPGTDGEAVLLAARERCPGAVRIILSGQTDHAVVQRTIEIAHQFLSKPCGVDELRACLESALALSAPLDVRTRDLVMGLGKLAVCPSSLARLKSLFEQPQPKPAEVAACIEQDAVLAAKLLHVASAGFYAERQAVCSVERALSVLGLETTLALLSTFSTYPLDGHAESLLRRSRCTSRLLRRMMDGEQARLCAALHGLGKVVLLARFGADYAELAERTDKEPGLRLHELEQERFGMSHELVGAHLLGLWGAPSALVEAMRALSDPALAAHGSELSLTLHVATVLTQPGASLDECLLERPEIAGRIEVLRAWAAELDTPTAQPEHGSGALAQ